MHTRREFVTTLAAGGLALASVGSAAGEEAFESPDDVTLSYDEEWLERYQPLLQMDPGATDRFTGMYAYRATSDVYGYDIGVYWARYAVQDGKTVWDSHQYDHEPIYVSVGDGGNVINIDYTGYHHFVSEVDAPNAPLSAIRDDDPTHVSMRVVSPWHHYQLADEGVGVFKTLRDWTVVKDEWADYGFFGGTHNPAVLNPYVIAEGRESWWESATWDYWLGRLFAQIGIRGGDQRDELRLE